MNARENFCGRCEDWIGPQSGEVRIKHGRLEAVCETCRAVEEAELQTTGEQNETNDE